MKVKYYKLILYNNYILRYICPPNKVDLGINKFYTHKIIHTLTLTPHTQN